MEGHHESEPAGHQQGFKERHGLRRDAKKHVSAQQGEDLEKQKGKLPPGEEILHNISRSVCVSPFENGLFF